MTVYMRASFASSVVEIKLSTFSRAVLTACSAGAQH